jgi:hypothetical protein
LETPLITYHLQGNKDYLVDVSPMHGRHPGEAIKRAKQLLADRARSQHDIIQIFSESASKNKLLGKVLFRASGTESQCIDWLPAKAPPFRTHSGEVRARGVHALARRGISHRK